ncbi:hypothetical protein M3210_02845 [Oceanobacillus luteolus]|uniref:hypothetical protein n=1 Tax=Oceanobacillus luteolus TaxID=1274358 RepID=UPI0020411366|nr:hypothetical protein [Oceanobacillus luteolus]MCM3739200.1 hypothetical protein [Oceanobacillus luteolus]
MNNTSNVRLPEWMWETAKDTAHLKELIRAYINVRYPGYTVLKVRNRIAVCEINR